MSPKSLLSILGIGIGVMLCSIIINQGIPFGYDYNYYQQFTNFYSSFQGNMKELSAWFRYQFEPFSGTFFYSLTSFLGKNFLYSWWYFIIFILTGISLVFFWKRGRYYTFGSVLGFFLFYFSSIQYLNLVGSLGKQLFATFFLLLALRHRQKLIISIPLFIACIGLHRLTGFVAILFILVSSFSPKKQNTKECIAFIGIIFAAIITYIPSFDVQVMPFLRQIIYPAKILFHKWQYWAGFSYIHFLYHIFPVTALLLIGLFSKKKYTKKNYGYIFIVILIGSLVIFRWIAYNRLESFLQLVMILLIIKYPQIYQKKWIWAVLVLQVILWSITVKEYFIVRISTEEYKNIEQMLSKAPKNIYIINLSHPYRAALAGRSTLDIRDMYNTLIKDMTKAEESKIRHDKSYFCEKLSQLNRPTFVYSWSLDNFASEQNNPCLIPIKSWKNWAQLLLFREQIMQNPCSNDTRSF